MWRTIIEPFRVRSVEPIRQTDRAQRLRCLERAGWNLFNLRSEDVTIDLLTDSGTGAMSARQWAALMAGDESYAGSPSFRRFERAVQDVTGMEHVIPVHQGRAAERILFNTVARRGLTVLSNGHFDTTRANIEAVGARAVDLPVVESADPRSPAPFKGNADVGLLDRALARLGRGRVPMVLMTITNNTVGGHPVSLANMREVRRVTRRHGVPLFLDAARFAENAWLVKSREDGQARRTPTAIARDFFDLADGCMVSAKKDGLANTGGFIAMRDPELAGRCRALLIVTEGFPTYGGLAGRDLEAIAEGLREVLDEDYLRYRIRSVEYMGDRIEEAGIAVVRPTGGHAVYLDAGRSLDHIPREALPGQALACELYLAGGIRGCEIGTVMFGRTDSRTGRAVYPALDLVRLAMPRRVYTQSHVDYVGEVAALVARRRQRIRGLRFVHAPPVLRHFTARFAPL